MAAVTVRNLPDAVHRALKARAAAHGRSTEAEIRAILEAAVRPDERLRVGSALAAFGAALDGLDLEPQRDPSPIEPTDFG